MKHQERSRSPSLSAVDVRVSTTLRGDVTLSLDASSVQETIIPPFAQKPRTSRQPTSTVVEGHLASYKGCPKFPKKTPSQTN
ncbi:hypothetical protein ILUMI_15739 [Ignelater luminosus]|uniref:Uncharacterized protein n=1 Tax=Ignelater luminosus TaxID=2038154 RepID=A0A8K0CPW0_IGNLU|nr:hypothetical protein ILUMI_15739 [Ignelater luminosus]